MSICIPKSRDDTHVMSLSELARRLNLPASRMKKAVAAGTIRTCGEIGHNTIVALTEDDLEMLQTQFNPPAISNPGG